MTETLAQKVCTPCRGGIPPLPPDEVARYARQLQNWAVKDEARRIERTYRFGNFREALAFVDQVGARAEAEGHHPHVLCGWLPRCKGSVMVLACWSGAVLCPASHEGAFVNLL